MASNMTLQNTGRNLNWAAIEIELDRTGAAVLHGLLSPARCQALAALYDQEQGFRNRVVMARHGFGRGEYRYFAYPLPPLVQELREDLYEGLSPIANRWHERLGGAAARPVRPGRRPCYCAMGQAILIVCTRTYTGKMSSRCRSQSCSPSPAAISRAASSS
jgi:hypothetical protein